MGTRRKQRISTLPYTEQDAFMNEYYVELFNSPHPALVQNNTETHRRYADYLKKYRIAKENSHNDDFIREINHYIPYGYNVKIFGIMIDKGIKRFAKKMKNIEKNYSDWIQHRKGNSNENLCHETVVRTCYSTFEI